MSDQDRLMGAGGDESQLGRRFDNNEDMEEGLRRVRAFKKRRQFALAQDAVQRIQQSLIQNAPSAGGVVSAEDRLRTQAMLTTVCKSGLAGLQQGSNSSEVIVVQGGMRFTHRESETVEEEKDMENFHILCPQVNSLKDGETKGYNVTKSGDFFKLVDTSETLPEQLSTISAKVCIFNERVGVFDRVGDRPDESGLFQAFKKKQSGKFQLNVVLLCKSAEPIYNLPPGAMLVYDIDSYVGVKDVNSNVPDFIIRKNFLDIRKKFPGIIVESVIARQENSQAKSSIGFFDELPAHAHSLKMFSSSNWYVVTISIDFCDFNIGDVTSNASLKKAFEFLESKSSTGVFIRNFFVDASEVVVPLDYFKSLTGNNQYCCNIQAFVSIAKNHGTTSTERPTLLNRMFHGRTPSFKIIEISPSITVAKIESVIKNKFMVQTPNEKFSCEPISEQARNAINNGQVTLSAKALEVTWAVVLNDLSKVIPHSFSAVLESFFFQGMCGSNLRETIENIDSNFMLQAICAACGLDIGQFYDGGSKLSLSDTDSTHDIIVCIVEDDFLNAENISSFSSDKFLIFILHMLLNLKGDSNFGRLIDNFDLMLLKFEDKCKISAECTDSYLQRMSHLYFISSMIGGMLATCDLLLEEICINGFPSDEFRKHDFGNFGDDVYCFLWNQYTCTPGINTYDRKNHNAAAPHYTFGLHDWVCYFATCQITKEGLDTDLRTHTAEAVKTYATTFVADIAKFNAETYVNHGDDKKKPTVPLTASLRNFCMSLGEHIRGFPDGKFSPRIYDVKPPQAV